jgi:NOL1/NOP2/sun family putative RNA methylase
MVKNWYSEGCMAKTPTEKLAAKREAWVSRTAVILNISAAEATNMLTRGTSQSLRINPLRGNVATTLEELRSLDWQGQSVAWAENCFTLDSPIEPIRDSQVAAEGRVFIQNAASWLPVLALSPEAGNEILDVCAAPGGKTSHIAAITNNQAIITANDNSRPRLAKMRANFERLGVNCARTTLFDATQIARKLEGRQFDKILLDAPCSGEGMMRLGSDKDFDTWSVAHIKRLQQLQKKIISQAWKLLAPGGTLVYSTCTMAPEENEAVVDYLLRTHPEAELAPLNLPLPNAVSALQEWNNRPFANDLSYCLRLTPSQNIEAFFVAKITKTGLHDEA